MEVLTLILYLYISIGVGYGLFLLFTKESSIWALPINILGGPIVLVYVLYKTFKKEKVRYP